MWAALGASLVSLFQHLPYQLYGLAVDVLPASPRNSPVSRTLSQEAVVTVGNAGPELRQPALLRRRLPGKSETGGPPEERETGPVAANTEVLRDE
ncbi:hypothetical protein HPB52_002217 [Rhipicephalus sanguineus]|uniref:Uncharacterized protein n=1 Tax=Rhipicephalus sanguineus TaxID=34632 RepID=A0A9D4SS93_RHISA|nr:hypothetical protein HPB52_002217 [Rhipicephalus sanguineus]